MYIYTVYPKVCYDSHIARGRSVFAYKASSGIEQVLEGSIGGPRCQSLQFPEGPSSQYLRSLVSKTIPLMVFGTGNLKYWVLGPSGIGPSINSTELVKGIHPNARAKHSLVEALDLVGIVTTS